MSLEGKDAQSLAARLKHRVIIQQPVDATDAAGGSVREWSDLAIVWAEIASRRTGGEAFFAGKLQATTTHVVTIRYRSDVSAQMRLSYDGRLFNIRRVDNRDTAGVLLELLVEEGAAL